jgi:hypothetical protein
VAYQGWHRMGLSGAPLDFSFGCMLKSKLESQIVRSDFTPEQTNGCTVIVGTMHTC